MATFTWTQTAPFAGTQMIPGTWPQMVSSSTHTPTQYAPGPYREGWDIWRGNNMADQVNYNCPICNFTSKSERGRNIHFGKMHKEWKLQQRPIQFVNVTVVNNVVNMFGNLNLEN